MPKGLLVYHGNVHFLEGRVVVAQRKGNQLRTRATTETNDAQRFLAQDGHSRMDTEGCAYTWEERRWRRRKAWMGVVPIE